MSDDNFRRMFDNAIASADLHKESHWPTNAGTPNPFTMAAYVDTLRDILNQYHTGAVNALVRCNAYDCDGYYAPRRLSLALMQYCWDRRVPLVKAAYINSVFLHKCRQWLPPVETAANADG